MGHVHLTRREILQSLPVLGAGALLQPMRGERPDTKTPGVIRGAILDGATGKPVAAKIRVTDLASGLRFDSDRGLWTDTRHKGPPFGLAFPFMLATKDARAKGRDILVERGYQWWRSKK